jgi:Skp family chaperone for outer membrane proteins
MRLFAALFVLILALAGAGRAQDGGILVVDLDRLFSESAFGKRVASEIQSRSATLAAENEQLKVELEAEELKLTAERASLTDEEFRKRADAFDTKAEKIRAEQLSELEAIRAIEGVERQTFLNVIVPVLAALLKERNGEVLLDRRAVMLLGSAEDITGLAVQRVNTALGDGSKPAP